MLFLGVFESSAMTDDFSRNRLDQMIDLCHPLAVLPDRMPWQEIETFLAQRWVRQLKAGKKIEELDLFGLVLVFDGIGISNADLPRLPARHMVAFSTSSSLQNSFQTNAQSDSKFCGQLRPKISVNFSNKLVKPLACTRHNKRPKPFLTIIRSNQRMLYPAAHSTACSASPSEPLR